MAPKRNSKPKQPKQPSSPEPKSSTNSRATPKPKQRRQPRIEAVSGDPASLRAIAPRLPDIRNTVPAGYTITVPSGSDRRWDSDTGQRVLDFASIGQDVDAPETGQKPARIRSPSQCTPGCYECRMGRAHSPPTYVEWVRVTMPDGTIRSYDPQVVRFSYARPTLPPIRCLVGNLGGYNPAQDTQAHAHPVHGVGSSIHTVPSVRSQVNGSEGRNVGAQAFRPALHDSVRQPIPQASRAATPQENSSQDLSLVHLLQLTAILTEPRGMQHDSPTHQFFMHLLDEAVRQHDGQKPGDLSARQQISTTQTNGHQNSTATTVPATGPTIGPLLPQEPHSASQTAVAQSKGDGSHPNNPEPIVTSLHKESHGAQDATSAAPAERSIPKSPPSRRIRAAAEALVALSNTDGLPSSTPQLSAAPNSNASRYPRPTLMTPTPVTCALCPPITAAPNSNTIRYPRPTLITPSPLTRTLRPPQISLAASHPFFLHGPPHAHHAPNEGPPPAKYWSYHNVYPQRTPHGPDELPRLAPLVYPLVPAPFTEFLPMEAGYALSYAQARRVERVRQIGGARGIGVGEDGSHQLVVARIVLQRQRGGGQRGIDRQLNGHRTNGQHPHGQRPNVQQFNGQQLNRHPHPHPGHTQPPANTHPLTNPHPTAPDQQSSDDTISIVSQLDNDSPNA